MASRTTRRALAGCGVIAVVALAGCGLCGDVVCGGCPPALTLHVSDAVVGGPVAGLAITGAAADCAPRADLGYSLCEIPVNAGSYQLDLTAPGYVTQTLTETINDDSGDSCCSCGYNPKVNAVAMAPSGA